MTDQVLINLVFILHWRQAQLLQIDRQVLHIPAVLLDLAELDALHRVCLQHATDQVFAVRWNLHWHPVVALLDLHKEYGQLLVIEGQAATDHGVEDNAAAPDVDLLTTILLS